MSIQTPDEAYPRLETERLVLRALRLEDADFVFKEWGDSVVTYYMWDEDPLQSREQAEKMLQPLQTPEKMPDFKWWGIELKAGGNGSPDSTHGKGPDKQPSRVSPHSPPVDFDGP